MTRYPRSARVAKITCVKCNAPFTETVRGDYVCVECGKARISEQELEPGSTIIGTQRQ